MGIVLAFVVGYVLGERSARATDSDLIESAKAVRDSDEFQAFVEAVRSHTGHVLREVADRVTPGSERTVTMQDVLQRLRDAATTGRFTGSGS
jgi:hypothetical protein